MLISRLLLVAGLTALIMAGCSEKQKEASRMEQEVRDLEESASTDTTALDSVRMVPEAPAAVDEAADASAIPPEARPKVTPTPMPPAPTGAGWAVQVASCESQDFARRLVDVYTSRGYQPYVTTITKGDQLYYRVRIGSFTDLAEARRLKDELIDRYSLAGVWIDRIER